MWHGSVAEEKDNIFFDSVDPPAIHGFGNLYICIFFLYNLAPSSPICELFCEHIQNIGEKMQLEKLKYRGTMY